MTALHCLTYRDHASCSPAWCGWNMPTMPWSAQLQGFLSFVVYMATSLPCFRLWKLMFVGPFSIQRVISVMAVRLQLLRSTQVQPTFRISKVKAPWSQPVLIDATHWWWSTEHRCLMLSSLWKGTPVTGVMEWVRPREEVLDPYSLHLGSPVDLRLPPATSKPALTQHQKGFSP